MTNIEDVKNEYYKEATALLARFPEVLKAFELAWQSGEFRKAHLVVHDAVRQLDLQKSPQQEKAFFDFYSLFVG